ncbi:MAG: LysR substrate-binding domain-containing protein [Crocinitomicaceae bacterium]
MTIQQLEYIVALDTYKHFVTAAEHCFVTQPTLTIQVKKLEDEIGVKLFDRKQTPLKTTKIGLEIISKSRNILAEVANLKQMVGHEKDQITGRFKIGVIPTVAPYLVPLFVSQFSIKYPETILEISELKSEDIISKLQKGSLDIGILVTPLVEADITETPLYYEPFVFYGSKNHPLLKHKIIEQKDLKKEKDLWLLDKGNCFRNQVLNLCLSEKQKKDKSIYFDSTSIESVKRMVSYFKGFTLIPELCISESDVNYRPLSVPIPVREVSIISHNTFVKEGLIDAIRKEILDIIPSSYKKNDRFYRVQWR